MTDRQQLETAVRRIDGELRRLTTPRFKLEGPGLLERVKEYAERYRESKPAREAMRREADALVPDLLELYTGGGDDDREWLRGLLHECPTFRWAFGWPMANPKPPVTAGQALTALALFSMKDGASDPRDQRVWLQELCGAARRSEQNLPALLRRAAEWSSDTVRFAQWGSTRALLLEYAERFTS
jgi:hypothetical protein